MPWAKIDDRFYLNPKVMRAGLEGRALYIAGLVHAAGGLTDGLIESDIVTRLALLADVTDVAGAAARLVELRLWEQTPAGYRIHDYLEYNPTREHIQHVREARSAAGQRGGRPLKPDAPPAEKQTESKLVSHCETHVPIPVPQELTTANRAVVAPAKPDAEPAPARKRRPTGAPRPPGWVETHPLFPPLVALFGRPAGREWSAWGQEITTLAEKAATPEEIPRRAANFPLVMPAERNGKPCTMTLFALVKHWHLCATVPTSSQNGGHDAEMVKRREADRRDRLRRDQEAAERYRADLADIVIPTAPRL